MAEFITSFIHEGLAQFSTFQIIFDPVPFSNLRLMSDFLFCYGSPLSCSIDDAIILRMKAALKTFALCEMIGLIVEIDEFGLSFLKFLYEIKGHTLKFK